MSRLFVLLASLSISVCALSACTRSTAVPGIVPAPVSAPVPGPEIRYSFLLAGNPAGEQVVKPMPDGSIEVRFTYSDRGRGPDITTRYALRADHVPLTVDSTGVDYFKAPVSEQFSIMGATASWNSRTDSGEHELEPTRPRFYVSVFAPPAEAAFLARALLAAPHSRLPLLPAGEARLETIATLTVTASPSPSARPPASSANAPMTVTLYAISGLGFTPTYVWLDSQKHYFASVAGWQTTIRQGFEESAATLLARQEQDAAARTAAIAQRHLRRPASGVLAIRHAALFDARTRAVIPNTTILIRENRIAAVGPDSTISVPPEAEILDARGKTVLPGLWDMHVHIDEEDGLLHLAAGVTSVRDLANDIELVRTVKHTFDSSLALGPRLLAAGFIDGPGPYAGPTKVLVANADEARRATQRYIDLGYPQIKLYSSLDPALVPVITELARARGVRVSGHIPARMLAADAVRAGYDEIQHMNMLLLQFMPDITDTQTPRRFTAVAERAGAIDLDSREATQFLALLAERGTVIDPTLSIFEELFLARPGAVSPGYQAVAARLPPVISRGLRAGGLSVDSPEQDARHQAAFAKMLAMLKRLEDAGIPIVAGTDSFAGFALHRELELYAAAGIPAPRVLQIATLDAARIMERDHELGVIEPGKLADIIVVAGNPAQDIRAIRKVVTVIKDGALMDAAALYSEVGVQPE